MTYPSPSAGPRSRSGTRRGGDDFQDLLVWGAALHLVRRDPEYGTLEVERTGNGNFDDVVLRALNGPDRLGQAKWSTNAANPFNEDYLTRVRGNGTSVLQKSYATFRDLKDSAPILELISNRPADPAHALLGSLDGNTNLVLPADGKPNRARQDAVAAWSMHLDTPEHDVEELLRHLRFRLGRDVAGERERVSALMQAAGLRWDDTALTLGQSCAKDWVVGGRRVVTPDDVLEDIARRGLRDGLERAVLLVQSLEWDPYPDDAHEVLKWVPLLAGENAKTRIAPVDPGSWGRMQTELEQAVQRLEHNGYTSALVRGTMRQATFFLVGASAPRTRGWSLTYTNRVARGPLQLWDTEAPRAPLPCPDLHERRINNGTDIAVAIGISTDPAAAVESHIQAANLPVGRLVTLLLSGGAHDQSLVTPGHAVALAQHVIEAVRHRLEDAPGTSRIHLFLAGPGGFAMVLGNRWNKVRPTVVYEHLGTGLGYMPAFHVHG